MTSPKINTSEAKVLAVLAAISGDFGCFSFRPIMRRTRLNRAAVRRACRSLARKGLARFHRGLWTEDGEPAGSGYCATEQGVAAADPELVEKLQIRWWDQ